MVWSNSDLGRFGWEKAATVNRIGAVSPAARLIPKIMPVRMPGVACGNTWWRTVCHLVAPVSYTHLDVYKRQRIKFETHRFARQQATWFRADDPRIAWFDLETMDEEEIIAFVERWL